MLVDRKVLVVDDEATICDVITETFEDWLGTEVKCENDGIAALEQLRGAKFSLALIDVDLPGVSGLEVAWAAVGDNTPVLILSGHPDMTTKLALVDLPHLEKPFRMADLLLEAQNAVACTPENVARVKAALTRLTERAGALQADMEEARRSLGESMVASAKAEGRSLK